RCRPGERHAFAEPSYPQAFIAGTRGAVARVRYRLKALAAVLVVLGCHGPHPATSGLPQGGEDVNALRIHRLARAANRLDIAGIEVALSRRSEPGAWAW